MINSSSFWKHASGAILLRDVHAVSATVVIAFLFGLATDVCVCLFLEHPSPFGHLVLDA